MLFSNQICTWKLILIFPLQEDCICWLIVVWIKEGKLSGFDEITTSFRTYGLDQLWLGSLCFGLRVESLGVANRGFATNFASWRSAPLCIPPSKAYGLHCMPLKDSSILSWIVEFIVEFIVELEFVQVQNCSVRICSTMTLINWFSDELTYCWVKIWPIGFWWIDHLLKVYHCWSGICFDRPVTTEWPLHQIRHTRPRPPDIMGCLSVSHSLIDTGDKKKFLEVNWILLPALVSIEAFWDTAA